MAAFRNSGVPPVVPTGTIPIARKPWANANYRAFCDMAFGRVPDDEAAWQAYQDYYFNCIRDADRHLVTVLDALQASGQAERTVVVFTADHGEMAGDHYTWGKELYFDASFWIPLIIRDPRAGSDAGRARLVPAAELQAGMVLARDLHGPDGTLLLAADYVLDARLVLQIQQFAQRQDALLQLHIRTDKRL